MEYVFTITNLRCSYTGDKIVLEIPALQLQRGKLIFVVGASGCGKSTLLETIGLMNRTIMPESGIFFSDFNGNNTELPELWKADTGQMDAFRKKHFSFIFQKTNLLPNFSCGENMMLPALFKGSNYADAKERVLTYMDRLSLKREIFESQITNVSGGQRQRLAFIRAMAADFSVLFGDEPTGNLDPNTAREVFSVLKEHLQTKHKTGIVVSHDISLAQEFADVVIPITMTGENGEHYGTVKQEHILTASGDTLWRDQNREYNEIRSYLHQLIA